MSAIYRLAVLATLSAFAMTGCAPKSAGQDKVLATVGNRSITLNDFKTKLSKMPPYYRGVAEKNKKTLFDDMIVESLFLEDAVRKGTDTDKEVREILEEARKKIIIAKYIKSEIDDNIKISGEEIKKYYEEHKDELKKPEMWRASHILVASEPEAKEVLAALTAGKSFEELAKQKSIDATAARSGDVGYFRKGQVVPEFENTCFNLSIGQTSGIVHTQFGYHIIKLTDRKSESVPPLEEAAAAIENELRSKKRLEAFGGLIAELKNKYRVTVEPDAQKAIEAISLKKESDQK
jgi:peptidyl-prolyl cis-trans isomerase C